MSTYTIQGADFSIRQEHSITTPGHLITVFNSYDWATEHKLESDLEAADKECCPAGLIIERAPYEFLQLCPRPDETIMTHCIHVAPKKMLGLFNIDKRTNLSAESLSRNIALKAIPKFINADNDWLLAHIK